MRGHVQREKEKQEVMYIGSCSKRGGHVQREKEREEGLYIGSCGEGGMYI